jgi:hypothetical protein
MMKGSDSATSDAKDLLVNSTRPSLKMARTVWAAVSKQSQNGLT